MPDNLVDKKVAAYVPLVDARVDCTSVASVDCRVAGVEIVDHRDHPRVLLVFHRDFLVLYRLVLGLDQSWKSLCVGQEGQTVVVAEVEVRMLDSDFELVQPVPSCEHDCKELVRLMAVDIPSAPADVRPY